MKIKMTNNSRYKYIEMNKTWMKLEDMIMDIKMNWEDQLKIKDMKYTDKSHRKECLHLETWTNPYNFQNINLNQYWKLNHL